MTTFTREADRVAMHAVLGELVERQAESAGLPLWPVFLPSPCSNQQYESIMAGTYARAVSEGIDAIAFGDLFLEEVRAYRDKQLRNTGVVPIFPLWGLPTRELAATMVSSGLRAKLTSIDRQQLGASFAGRESDESLLVDLPGSVDPCGEKGEFPSFVSAGPMLRHTIPVAIGEQVVRGQFVFTDLIPQQAAVSPVR